MILIILKRNSARVGRMGDGKETQHQKEKVGFYTRRILIILGGNLASECGGKKSHLEVEGNG